MIFILTEHAMNGTVTMSVKTTLIEAESFDKAFEKLTHFPNWHLARGLTTYETGITYYIGTELWGELQREPAKVV